MEQIRAITVNNVKYNVAQASAVEQQKLMLLIGAKVALHSATSEQQIDKNLLIGTLLTLPEDTFNNIANVVLGKAIKAGDDTPIDVKSFQGAMMTYFSLVAEAICFNLDDFFT